jgi:hypothetical protein
MVMHLLAHPISQIAILSAGMAILLPVYGIAQAMNPSPAAPVVMFAAQYALPITIILWIASEARDRRQTPCFDFTFWLLVFWPLSLFWWCIKTRGWWGVLVALGLLVLASVPAVFATMMDIARMVF